MGSSLIYFAERRRKNVRVCQGVGRGTGTDPNQGVGHGKVGKAKGRVQGRGREQVFPVMFGPIYVANRPTGIERKRKGRVERERERGTLTLSMVRALDRRNSVELFSLVTYTLRMDMLCVCVGVDRGCLMGRWMDGWMEGKRCRAWWVRVD